MKFLLYHLTFLIFILFQIIIKIKHWRLIIILFQIIIKMKI